MKFTVIGISDNPQPWFPPKVLELIRNGRVFSGGKRHHEIMAPLLPPQTEWIDISVPLDDVFKKYHDDVVVFASGDPLFFGFANTIKRKMPEAKIVLYPSFNSLQILAHRLIMPYHDMRIVSLTGRPWPEFDKALIERVEKIGILTDKEHTPAAIAQRMIAYGYTDYTMFVGEHLGNPLLEKVTTLTLGEAAQREFEHPNCLILNLCNLCNSCVPPVASEQSSSAWSKKLSQFGIPDSEFALLDGREKMITKMPIRLLTLQALDLPQKHVLWDIGFCTGSVSIEARLLFPHLEIHAFEIRPECEAIINENTRRHHAPGINVHIGDFLNFQFSARPLVACKARIFNSQLPHPDAVFIGGHGGKLKEIMSKVLTVLTDDGIIVFNSVVAPKVTVDSKKLWDEACDELGLQQLPPLHIQLNDNHPITISKGKKVKK